jgi:molybdenum cofactor guanylyltransferase
VSVIAKNQITGLVLAGGKGSRMGGVDKGLQLHSGTPLAQHALLRLRPQVAKVLLNANRNQATYDAFGAPVWPDALPDQPGPLAGFLTGLAHCETDYLVTVPCDTPHFPEDLVARLAQAMADNDADIAMAATNSANGVQVQPVFCLMKASLKDSLAQFTASGQRKIDKWTATHRCIEVLFDDELAFFNANTAEELKQLQPRHA